MIRKEHHQFGPRFILFDRADLKVTRKRIVPAEFRDDLSAPTDSGQSERHDSEQEA